jgi:hypothetical protein
MQSSRGNRLKKGITAWLITWEWMGDHAKAEQKIAAILNPRWSSKRVREYVESIYVDSHYSIAERIAYAKTRSFNPYPAEFVRVSGVAWEGQITCGHNPWLFARLVSNLAAAGESDGHNGVIWSEQSVSDFENNCRKLGIGEHERIQSGIQVTRNLRYSRS